MIKGLKIGLVLSLLVGLLACDSNKVFESYKTNVKGHIKILLRNHRMRKKPWIRPEIRPIVEAY